MNIQQQELQKAIEFVRQTLAEKNQHLDYTPASVKYLDALFDNEFKNGKLRKPDSSFAKFQGIIITGVSGYIGQVILKNTGNTQLVIDPADEKWFINFKVTTPSGNSIQPALRVIKRMMKGDEMSLYTYVLSSIGYFLKGSPARHISPDNSPFDAPETAKKPWWKLWR